MSEEELIDMFFERSEEALKEMEIKYGKICLNNKPYYQRLILDQGYWKESGTTPPSVEALKKDIKLCKAMGFNGARKHQKMEDPYWYYLADEMGFFFISPSFLRRSYSALRLRYSS